MIKSGIITPDTHFNKHDVKAYELHMRFAEDFKPDIWIHLGDMGNFDGVSHWNKDKFKEQMKNPLSADYQECRKYNMHRRRICPKGKLYQLDGNHEGWVLDWADKYPALDSMADLDKEMGVKEYGIERIKEEDQPLKVGKIYFIHGWYTNMYHTSKHARFIHGNLVYGHCHDMQEDHSKNIDPTHRQVVCSMGHLMDENKAGYLKHRPTNWIQGFGVFYMDSKTGLFSLYRIKIVNHQFYWNGKRYK